MNHTIPPDLERRLRGRPDTEPRVTQQRYIETMADVSYFQIIRVALSSFTQVSASLLQTAAAAVALSMSTSAAAELDAAFVNIEGGARHTCGITAKGAVSCWGREAMGKGTYPLVASSVYKDSAFSHLGAGTHQGFGLTDEGKPVCWGENDTGQCDVIDDSFVAVSGADKHVCALTPRQSIHCWGEDVHMNVSAFNGGTYSTLDSGYFHTCGVDVDGGIDCYGCEQGGRDRSVNRGQCDTAALPSARYVAVAAGRSHTCGLTSAGAVDCIGANRFGQADAPDNVEFVQIDAGSMHTCGIETGSGRLFCWGRNQEGQATPPTGKFMDVTAGFKMSCGLLTSGKVTCWGEDSENFVRPPEAYRLR